MDNRKHITRPAINMAIQEALKIRALCTNHHMERLHQPPKPLPGVTATTAAEPNGEPVENPPAPPENSPPEDANMCGKRIEEHKVYKCGFRNILNPQPLGNTVHNVVNHVMKTCYQVSRLLQLHTSDSLKTIWNFLTSTPPGCSVFSDLSRIYFRPVMRTTAYRKIS